MSLTASEVNLKSRIEIAQQRIKAKTRSNLFFHLDSLTQPQGYCIMSASSLLAEADLTAYRNPAFQSVLLSFDAWKLKAQACTVWFVILWSIIEETFSLKCSTACRSGIKDILCYTQLLMVNGHYHNDLSWNMKLRIGDESHNQFLVCY